jgi:hypothetical protein
MSALTTRRRRTGVYDLYLDGTYLGDIYQDPTAPRKPWRFCPAFGAIRRPWAPLVGPYPTKRAALDALTDALTRPRYFIRPVRT